MKPLNYKERNTGLLQFILVFGIMTIVIFTSAVIAVKTGKSGVSVLQERNTDYRNIFEKKASLSNDIDEILKYLYQLKNKDRSLTQHKQFQVLISSIRDKIAETIQEGRTGNKFIVYQEMIDEINLLRQNPSGYVPYVQEYIMSMEKEIQKDPSMANMYLDEISTAYELIKTLRITDPLSTLRPHEGVYDAAKIHGQDLRKNTQFGHIGSDGSYPWDRIIKAAPDLSDGNENLVGGPYEVRQAVILLLVDAGIPDRGHRKTLLNPHWSFIACHELGQIGTMPNCWIQNFGKK